jgi:hypothetical protein
VHDAMNVAEVEDGSGSPAADAATGFNGQPCWQYVFCAQDGNGGPWNCDCGGPKGMAPCPASVNPGAACVADAAGGDGCYWCSEGAGAGCGCTSAFGPQYDGGPVPNWMCIGSENACGVPTHQ